MTRSGTAQAEWRSFWFLPIVAAIGYSTAVLHTYGIGAFMAPLQAEFGWSRAQISVGLAITGFGGALLSVPLGLLVDRIGPRVVALVGVASMTGAFALLGTASGSIRNWIALWCLVAFANTWLQATVWTSAVASRFEKSRGLAFAVTLSGASLSAIVFPVLATYLIQSYGWRNAFTAMGVIWAAFVLPVLLLFFRSSLDGGRKASVAKKDAAAAAAGMTTAEALRTSAFYKLFLASGLFTFTAIGIIVHFVPILTDRGTEPLVAAGVASLVGFFSIVGRLGTGFLLDRFAARFVGAVVFLLPILSCALLLLDGSNRVSQSIAAGAFGLTVGAEIDVIAYLTARYFGLRDYGVIFGAMTGALLLGIACGPLAAGTAFDRFGSYAEFLMLTAGFMAASSLALATLGRPHDYGVAH